MFIMQRYFFLFVTLFLLGGSASAQRPNTGTCWDFEEPCVNPSNAFYELCIPDAFASSGSPDNSSSYFGLDPVPSGQRYAHMAMWHCPRAQGEPAYQSGEGILLNTTIDANHKYELKFYTFGPMPNGELTTLGVHLVSGLPNNGGAPNAEQPCWNSSYLIPDLPASTQTLNNQITASGSTGWIEQRVVFIASGNFSQIWFRPFMNMANINPSSDMTASFYIDNVCIRDITCEVEKFKVTGCRPNENPDQVLYTITGGSNVAQGDWKLYKLPSCNSSILGPEIPINWQSSNSFLLTANTECYSFGYRIDNPLCEQRFVSVTLNTAPRELPLCKLDCVNWDVSVTEEYCNTISFHILQAFPFPPGTTITATMNGSPVELDGPGMVFYYPITQGDQRWVKVCFTVHEPGCAPETKCAYFYVGDCDGGGRNASLESAKTSTSLRINNPADTYIRLSQPLGQGVAELYSMQGALLKAFQLNDTQFLDVADMPNGQYMLSIRHAGGRDSRLVLILHQP